MLKIEKIKEEIERNYGGGKYNFEMAEVMEDE